MKKAVITSLFVAGLLASGLATGAQAAAGDGTCDSGEFCAYNYSGWRGLLLESSAPVGTGKVDVANDKVTSFKNKTNNCWQGINVRTALPDQIVLRAVKNTSNGDATGDIWNETIDQFRVVTSC